MWHVVDNETKGILSRLLLVRHDNDNAHLLEAHRDILGSQDVGNG